jgi:hypothetical protein
MAATAIRDLTNDSDWEIYVENGVSNNFPFFLNEMLVGAKLFVSRIL